MNGLSLWSREEREGCGNDKVSSSDGGMLFAQIPAPRIVAFREKGPVRVTTVSWWLDDEALRR